MKKKKVVYKDVPNDYELEGQILYFKEGLVLFDENDKVRYLKATGGFGCSHKTMGRMIVGDFYATKQDLIDDNLHHRGNTKCFPDKIVEVQ